MACLNDVKNRHESPFRKKLNLRLDRHEPQGRYIVGVILIFLSGKTVLIILFSNNLTEYQL